MATRNAKSADAFSASPMMSMQSRGDVPGGGGAGGGVGIGGGGGGGGKYYYRAYRYANYYYYREKKLNLFCGAPAWNDGE